MADLPGVLHARLFPSMAIAAIVIADIAIAYSPAYWFTDRVTEREQALERLISALVKIEDGTAENVERSLEIQRRVKVFRERLQAGADVTELVEREEPPRVVELISQNMAVLETAGAELRAVQALALRAEGLTIEAIADLFGVTRQRISALLKQKAAIES